MDKWTELLEDLGFENIEDKMILKSLLEDEKGGLQETESNLTDAALELGKLKKRAAVFGEEDLNAEDQKAMTKLLPRAIEDLEAERERQQQRIKKLEHQLDALA